MFKSLSYSTLDIGYTYTMATSVQFNQNGIRARAIELDSSLPPINDFNLFACFLKPFSEEGFKSVQSHSSTFEV